jgi:nucleoside-diphosphate-sugar epimerase
VTRETRRRMKVFIAGASGVLGRRLIPTLVANGHEVVGMTRTGAKRSLLEGLGAAPVVADVFDPEAVGKAVGESGAEVVVHQLTAIPAAIDMRRNPDKLGHLGPVADFGALLREVREAPSRDRGLR